MSWVCFFTETQLTAIQGPIWKNLMVHGPGEMRSPGHPVDFQGSLPPSSRIVYPSDQGSLGKGSKRPAWMNKELLNNLKQKKESYRGWKQGQAAWEI